MQIYNKELNKICIFANLKKYKLYMDFMQCELV